MDSKIITEYDIMKAAISATDIPELSRKLAFSDQFKSPYMTLEEAEMQ